ncbi:3',5'-cyclic-AMP phosphodiesterase [Glaesserella sp.]|uniref:3',5'-cyclic-AMP phosphodiesterase n=1 Tax=Glaesserella sp. TaxID=2094731 RepID=UPI0035A0E9D4
MDDVYHLNTAAPAVRILQITDPHLFATDCGELLGVNTTLSFQAVLNAINQETFEYDIVLATGDLVQDHNREAYHRFGQMVKSLNKPLFWVEGNHDIQPQMENALAIYAQIQPFKHILAGEHWQVILLNSQVYGVPRGELSYQQLEFLYTKLAAHPERHALIVLHHNVLPTNSAWLDQHSLSNSHQLAELLNHFPRTKVILHGHIHQEVDRYWHGCRVLATPSTCIQFKPNHDAFTLDPIPQGWRELSLMPDGSVQTVVKRLDCNDFLPNFKAVGY